MLHDYAALSQGKTSKLAMNNRKRGRVESSKRLLQQRTAKQTKFYFAAKRNGNHKMM